MDRLSSCYFCGTALDAPLEEYPVVPAKLRPDTDAQRTVVLCGTCRRKLDAVLDVVVEAVGTDTGGVTASAGGEPEHRRAGADADPADGGTGADDIESTLGDDEAILSSLDGGDAVDGADSDSADADRDGADDGVGPKKRKYTESRGAGFRRDDEPAETGSLTGGAFSGDDDADGGEQSPTGPSPGEPPASSSESGDESAADGSAGDEASSAGDAEEDDGAGDDADRSVTVTRLENTRVMRLLENREFPVDREEFVTVAANAYQISRADCDKVIDLAVEHDLLREENGQLYGSDA